MDIFPFFYFAPIEYYHCLLKTNSLQFELFENFTKQTYRNRCSILSSNGKTNLVIPILKTGTKTLMKDVEISYKENWQKDHWRAIISAYKNSPFFEYYNYLFEPLFEKKYRFLTELNNELHLAIMKCLDEKYIYSTTKSYTQLPKENDLRLIFNAKKETNLPLHFKEYTQVFSDRIPFLKNLSILDLIFNLGPESRIYLKSIQ